MGGVEAKCESGTVPAIGSGFCKVCDAGRAPSEDFTSCEECDAGRFEMDHRHCALCKAGRFSTAGSTSCTSCMLGQYQALSGRSSCDTCSDYTDTEGPSLASG